MATLHFLEQGFLARTRETTVLIGSPSTELTLDGAVLVNNHDERLTMRDITVTKHPSLMTIALPDATVLYIHGAMLVRGAKKHACNVLILADLKTAEKFITSLKPRLAVLPSGTLEQSRAIQKKTGIQTVIATPGTILNLKAYSALSSQQRLGAFTEI